MPYTKAQKDLIRKAFEIPCGDLGDEIKRIDLITEVFRMEQQKAKDNKNNVGLSKATKTSE